MVDVRIRGQLLGDCSPFLVANGGPGSISRQIAESDVDVVLGGGMQHFEPLAEGRTENVLALAAANQFHIINDSSALAEAPGDGKLLGLFSPSTMPVQLRGEDGRKAEPPKPSWGQPYQQIYRQRWNCRRLWTASPTRSSPACQHSNG